MTVDDLKENLGAMLGDLKSEAKSAAEELVEELKQFDHDTFKARAEHVKGLFEFLATGGISIDEFLALMKQEPILLRGAARELASAKQAAAENAIRKIPGIALRVVIAAI